MTKKRQDEIAANAIRKSTLRSFEVKKKSRLKFLRENYEQAVREVNIQFAEDPERLKAKYAAEDFARSERAKRRAAKKIEAVKKEFEYNKSVRRATLGEEITSAIIQGIGACLFIAAIAILDTIAAQKLQSFFATTIVFYSLFGSTMILMYLFSTLRHALTNIVAKQVFSRLSHIFSFLSIGFAYSAYTITKIQGVYGWILFGIVWGLVLIGILFYAISGRKYEKLNIVLATLAGASGLAFAKLFFDVLSPRSFTMLCLAAVFYVIGILFYSLRKVKYMHVIANIFFLVGSVYLFFSMFFIA